MSTGYLGPEGTFTHQAAQTLRPHEELVPMATQRSAIEAVCSGALEAVVLPIDNSVQGPVIPTWDAVLGSRDVVLADDVCVDVAFNAYTRDLKAPRTAVVSHPHALAQCSRWVTDTRLPSAAATSTAAACRDLGSGEIAVASAFAGQRYGLTLVAQDIADQRGAVTQFGLFTPRTQSDQERGATGLDVLAVVPDANRAGAFLELLAPLAHRSLNLVNLVTLPIPTSDREVLFLMFVEGLHSHLPEVTAELVQHGAAVAHLGGLSSHARSRTSIARALPERLTRNEAA